MRKIKFVKMCAGGNDFIIIDNCDNILPEDRSALAKEVCRRKFSVGADGLLLLESSSQADFKMRIFNPDGSEPEMCGNGARCIARFAYLRGIAGKKMSFETRAGRMGAEIIDERVKLGMGEPTDMGLNLEISLKKGIRGSSNKLYKLHKINTGVPHAVSFVDNLEEVEVKGLGSQIRYHPHFQPEGTNADFVQVVDGQTIKMRTYERGVEDETRSCGTGAVASAVVAFSLKKVAEIPLRVETRGGEVLKVYFNSKGQKMADVYLEGEARIIYEGELKWKD
ncbi:diaminopimelate epimerase [bacterium]|nr:diaminopimelate epimerase [bacterium]MCK4436510.1 diaminopimelate epimerase [bacterium]